MSTMLKQVIVPIHDEGAPPDDGRIDAYGGLTVSTHAERRGFLILRVRDSEALIAVRATDLLDAVLHTTSLGGLQ